jgi:hypothetical protein
MLGLGPCHAGLGVRHRGDSPVRAGAAPVSTAPMVYTKSLLLVTYSRYQALPGRRPAGRRGRGLSWLARGSCLTPTGRGELDARGRAALGLTLGMSRKVPSVCADSVAREAPVAAGIASKGRKTVVGRPGDYSGNPAARVRVLLGGSEFSPMLPKDGAVRTGRRRAVSGPPSAEHAAGIRV